MSEMFVPRVYIKTTFLLVFCLYRRHLDNRVELDELEGLERRGQSRLTFAQKRDDAADVLDFARKRCCNRRFSLT